MLWFGPENLMTKANDAPAPERLHALDAVRGFALLLGIVLHATLSFMPPAIADLDHPGQPPQPHAWRAVLAIHVFRMTTFFLIAGFFAHLSFHRRGAWGLSKMVQRSPLPLLVGWPFLFASMVAVTLWAAGFPNGGPLPGPPRWPPVLPRFPLTHLWFLYVLLELYVAALVLRAGVVWLDPSGRLTRAHRRPDGSGDAEPVRAARCWPCRSGSPVPRSDMVTLVRGAYAGSSLVTNLQAWIGFGTAFGFGWLLHRQVDLIRMLERRWLLNSVLAVVLIAASFFLAVAASTPPQPVSYSRSGSPSHLLRAGDLDHDLCRDRSCAALPFRLQRRAPLYRRRLLLALSHSSADPDGAAGRGLALDWPWPLKFAAIMLIALPLMFASYQWLVRYSFIGAVLNGRRERREGTTAVTPRGLSTA